MKSDIILRRRTGAALARGKSKQDYSTPPDFIAAVTKLFGPLAFDLAADDTNSKAGTHFFGLPQNSLVQPWHEIKGTLWLNPPFDNIEPWARKCAEESAKGARILFLTPASVGSNWWRDHVYRHALVLACNGRIHFDPANPTWGYPKDCQLACYGWGVGFRPWTWKG